MYFSIFGDAKQR